MADKSKLTPEQKLLASVRTLLSERNPESIKRRHRLLDLETTELNPRLAQGLLSERERTWLKALKEAKVPLKQWIYTYEAKHGTILLGDEEEITIEFAPALLGPQSVEQRASL